MPTGREHRSRAPGAAGRRAALLFLLLFQGVSGMVGGVGLVADASGSTLGIPLEWLEGSPFPDYLIPGTVLLTGLGLGPLVVAYGVWRRRAWAQRAALVVGIGLVGWLGVQIAVIGYQSSPPLQLIYGLAGLAITACAMRPLTDAGT